MKYLQNKLVVALLALFFLTGVADAQQIDENTINELVQKEVDRILNSEVFDAAIERGIQNFIDNQRQAEQQAQNGQQREKVKNLRPVDPAVDHILGNMDAPITLVEYSDFECPFCKRFHPTVVELLENNPDKLRWVYRHFPLGFHNPGAQKQAEASECVAELKGNDAFWQYSDLIYARTTSNGTGFPLDRLQPLAEELGVDRDAFAECMESERMVARVQQDIDNGISIGVSGTPMAVILNNSGEARIVAGALPLSQLQGIVDELMQSVSVE
jgi:protein-disulfide isomerase